MAEQPVVRLKVETTPRLLGPAVDQLPGLMRLVAVVFGFTWTEIRQWNDRKPNGDPAIDRDKLLDNYLLIFRGPEYTVRGKVELNRPQAPVYMSFDTKPADSRPPVSFVARFFDDRFLFGVLEEGEYVPSFNKWKPVSEFRASDLHRVLFYNHYEERE